MTVAELKKLLDDYGDHLEVKMLRDDGELVDVDLEDDIASSGGLVIKELE